LFVLSLNGTGEAAYVPTGLAPRLSLDFAGRIRVSPSIPDKEES